MVYEQSVYWIKTNFIKEKLWQESNWLSGRRKESERIVELDIGRSLFDEIKFKMNVDRMQKLKKYFDIIRKDLKSNNLDFDAIVYLYNEIVVIDKEKRDNRSYVSRK